MDDRPEIESKVAPPVARCAHCQGMLPLGLGEKTCVLCGAVCRVTHERTIIDLREEKIPCPKCSTLVIAGTDERPVDLICGSCQGPFRIIPKVVKVEIGCPSCDRMLRLRPRPGSRKISCPACESEFSVTF